MTTHFPGRLGLQQRVLPDYRIPFFDMLAAACDGGLSVFAGRPRRGEGITDGHLSSAEQVRAQNIHVLSGALYLCLQPGLTRWLSDWDPNALILEANPRYLSTASAVAWMHARGRRVIGWGLGAPAQSGPYKQLRAARRRHFLSGFDALIAYSQRGAREYADVGFPRERIFVATNAVAARPQQPPQRISTSGRLTVLFVGRLQARKHVDSLLQACAEMHEPRPRLVIVGDGPERNRLELLARQVYPSAEFVGAKHGETLRPYFLEADLFVLPGTGGLAIQEAMAHALPVIVARGDGTQDDLVREENGWQIPPEDHSALVSTLQLALGDSGRLRRMGDESLRIVSQEINLETMLSVFMAALHSPK
jgi:glycosyltransferase involved in cell wall biosynthesis